VADVRPFRALRYDDPAGELERLVCPPYDVIDDAERTELLAASPYNAIRLELPELEYDLVGALIDGWLGAGILRRAETPGIVAWTQTFALDDGGTLERKVLLAAVKVEPYEARVVRPHERTHAGPKEDRLRLLYGAKAQISPVYGVYPDDAGAVWTAAAVTGEPFAQLTGRDGTLNRFWWIDEPVRCAAVTAAMAGRWILIADGHHRYETAVRYREERRAAGDGDGPHDFVMMGLTAIEDPGLVVLPTHRLLTQWPEGAADVFAKTTVTSEESLKFALNQTPVDAPAFGLVTPNGAWILTAPASGGASPAAHLDVAVLEARVLERAFGKDQAALAHDGVLSYTKDTTEAWRLGSSGQVAAALILRPMPKAAVTEVAEAGETMPQKSTYFFPKLLTGVAFHSLEEPIDLGGRGRDV
jgi:uncharacterized protein (DUF1015 family)